MAWVSLDEGHVVFRDRDHLVFRKAEPATDFRITVIPNHRYEFGRFRFSSRELDGLPAHLNGNKLVEYVDADRIASRELVLRTWTEGDTFVPLGMRSKKKISDFFVDARIPLFEKRNYPILETKDGDVVWVCGQRIDDRFKITSDTRHILKLEFTRILDPTHGEKH